MATRPGNSKPILPMTHARLTLPWHPPPPLFLSKEPAPKQAAVEMCFCRATEACDLLSPHSTTLSYSLRPVGTTPLQDES